MAESGKAESRLKWSELPGDVRAALAGRLTGLWGATSDEAAFDSWEIDKQHALLLCLRRMQAKDLWHVVKQITNVYGEGGVGLQFFAWPVVESTLRRRSDFTRRFANHKDTTGGFYEKHRSEAVLHFLFQEGTPRTWYVHFDLYSPVHSVGSALKHFRHEFVGKVTPDWRMISKCLNADTAQGKIGT
jgi:hypothetical protein